MEFKVKRGDEMLSQVQIIDWLLSGDVSIRYQVYRNLLNIERQDLRNRIEKEGWGARFLALRNNNGHWGRGFYQPKWISTHYTLRALRMLKNYKFSGYWNEDLPGRLC
jgi:hypothetical protein